MLEVFNTTQGLSHAELYKLIGVSITGPVKPCAKERWHTFHRRVYCRCGANCDGKQGILHEVFGDWPSHKPEQVTLRGLDHSSYHLPPFTQAFKGVELDHQVTT